MSAAGTTVVSAWISSLTTSGSGWANKQGSGPSMRIAIVSDIHANLTAFEAVLSDLDETSPDLIMHGGDLADGGANGAAWSETRTKCWRRPRFLRSLPASYPN